MPPHDSFEAYSFLRAWDSARVRAGRKRGCEAEHQHSQLWQIVHQKLTCRLSKATMWPSISNRSICANVRSNCTKLSAGSSVIETVPTRTPSKYALKVT